MASPVDNHLKSLESAPLDAWVALTDDDQLVATGATYDEAVRKSEAAGVDDPIIVKTPKEWSSLSLGQSTL